MGAFAELADVGGVGTRRRQVVHDGGGGAEDATAQGRVRLGARANHTERAIDEHAHHEADERLGREDARNDRRVRVLGEQDRQHLVGGRQEHGHERAKRHDPAGVEGGPHGREATLRHDAEDGTHDGAGRASLADERVHARAGGVLEGLEHNIGHEQERNENERILHRVGKDVEKQLHGLVTPIDD